MLIGNLLWRRDLERMNDCLSHEDLVELIFPFLVRLYAGFLVRERPPFRRHVHIDLEHPYVGVKIVLVLWRNLDPAELDQCGIDCVVCNTGKFQELIV